MLRIFKRASRLEHCAATYLRNVTMIRRSGRCCCNIRSVRFAARSDPPCCRFSSAHQRMLRYTAIASSYVFLCSLRTSQAVACSHARSSAQPVRQNARRLVRTESRTLRGCVTPLRCCRILVFARPDNIPGTVTHFGVNKSSNTQKAVWVMTPCSLVNIYQCFGSIYFFLLRGKIQIIGFSAMLINFYLTALRHISKTVIFIVTAARTSNVIFCNTSLPSIISSIHNLSTF